MIPAAAQVADAFLHAGSVSFLQPIDGCTWFCLAPVGEGGETRRPDLYTARHGGSFGQGRFLRWTSPEYSWTRPRGRARELAHDPRGGGCNGFASSMLRACLPYFSPVFAFSAPGRLGSHVAVA